MKPIINPATKDILDNLVKKMPQSLLLTGQKGVGLAEIAKYLSNQISTDISVILPEKDDKIDLEKGVITVDIIRDLYSRTRSIKSGKQVIIIDYAETMGPQAQNAFLKLLEEPGSNVYFILVTHEPSKLLPTITSRAQSVEIRPITRVQTEKLLDSYKDLSQTKRQQLLFMAEGLPALLTTLIEDSEFFDKRSGIMRDARDILQANAYKKLFVANKYASDRETALVLLNDVAKILRRTISDKPQESLIARLDSLIYTYQQVKANGNIRLNLARFVL